MVVRIALQYSSPQNAGPASVVAKFAHPEAANRAIANNTNMYEREVDFFNKTAHNVATPMPMCYFASMNYDTGGNIVVIERDDQPGIQYIKRITKIEKKRFWVEGDNSEPSIDSRSWGFLTRKEIIGKFLFRYWKGKS
jgi:hypothetical protein